MVARFEHRSFFIDLAIQEPGSRKVAATMNWRLHRDDGTLWGWGEIFDYVDRNGWELVSVVPTAWSGGQLHLPSAKVEAFRFFVRRPAEG